MFGVTIAIFLVTLLRKIGAAQEIVFSHWGRTPKAGDHSLYVTTDGSQSLTLAIRASIESALRTNPESRFVVVAPSSWPVVKRLSKRAAEHCDEVTPEEFETWLRAGGDFVNKMVRERIRRQLEQGRPVHVIALYSAERLQATSVRSQIEWEVRLHREVVPRVSHDISIVCGYNWRLFEKLRKQSTNPGEYDELARVIFENHDLGTSLALGEDDELEHEQKLRQLLRGG